MRTLHSLHVRVALVAVTLILGCVAGASRGEAAVACTDENTIHASVVALDQVIMINRLGAVRPAGMIYALEHDVVPVPPATALSPGHVQLRAGKRPRPLVLRVNEGQCLRIQFKNLLNPGPGSPLQPVTRNASVHVAGLQPVSSIADDGTYVGANGPSGSNQSGVVAPGGRAVYTLYAAAQGTYLMYSTPADFNGFGTEQLTMGLFGAVNVEPRGAEWYRSQITHEELGRAARLVPAGPRGPAHYQFDYDALDGRGTPVLNMVQVRGTQRHLVHGDLTAVITGPNRGLLPPGHVAGLPDNPALPDRRQPFREITVHYHESQDVVQAFPWAYNPANAQVADLNAGLDGFAINYGIAGITSQVLANRFGVGPARDCADCKFEEFFLSSWAGGDPAMVVDYPANLPCTTSQMLALDLTQSATPPCAPGAFPKATKAFFPDDPSNVYHSYLGDHVRFQILHAGASVHHVHHHHAHQWLHSPKSDQSHYLDSQAIGPGSSFTLDLVYAGSGNKNLTAGDSIFHCHFYPHFAAGMWSLFRVHDVFEAGTELDAEGRPAPGARALPDAEILAGTPIPAVVPLPTRAMAPLPEKVRIVDGQVQVLGSGHPGYPFFVPGIAGRRPPHPPLDFAQDKGEQLDGGLPRHLVLDGAVVNEQHTTTDFSKDLGPIVAIELPEKGTPAEITAMQFFGRRLHPSSTPDGQPADFVTNGLPRKTPANPTGAQPGAPFADPGVDEDGNAVGDLIHGQPRLYKGVNLQVDAVFNKKGWHYPQQRMMALWNDVQDILKGAQAPEPLFFRANSGDLVEYWHANLVPGYYELDDFQVRTPTDILGQHIHLVKFDVMASDGAANGFNYEDGTFSPDEVRDRISGINALGGLWSHDRSSQRTLRAKPITEFGPGPKGQWVGAQATVQRWYVDPLFNHKKEDRTYMTVFTHDHFGPSTHQEAGLYGGLLVEPKCSRWTSPDGTQTYGTRGDGGPTSSAANIIPDRQPGADCPAVESYREFALAWGDLQLVYQPTSKSRPDCYTYGPKGQFGQTPANTDCLAVAAGASYTGWSDPAHAINAPVAPAPPPPSPPPPLPNPRLVSDFGNGTFSLNYRNEPLPLRVAFPAGTLGTPNPAALDLSHVFRSISRVDPAMGSQPVAGSRLDPSCTGPACFTFPVDCRLPVSPGPANGCGVLPTDPYTPLLRAYENDDVQIRVLAGAHTSMHDFTLHGMKWLFEPFDRNSGYRNSQLVLLSEHYEMLFKTPPVRGDLAVADYLYNPSASYEGLVNGIWGLLRAYKHPTENLAPLPNNPRDSVAATPRLGPPAGLSTDCASPSPCLRVFRVSALSVRQATVDARGLGLVYNSRGARTGQDAQGRPQFGANPLYDPDALLYVRDEDLDARGRLRPGINLEPLVLRAAAGDWIKVILTNRLNPIEPVFVVGQSAAKPANTAPYTNPYAAITIFASPAVGLHPQLVAFDVAQDNGVNVGVNPVQTVAPGDRPCAASAHPCREYLWYAGHLEVMRDGTTTATPMEFGAVNLMPSDPLMHVYRGLFGALIIEPRGATWREDTDYRSSATVFPTDAPPFREFVLMAQDDVGILLNGHSMYASGNNLSAFNYRSEPFFYRFGSLMNPAMQLQPPIIAPANWAQLSAADLANISSFQFSGLDTTLAASNRLVAGDPQTPIFRAPAGMPVRFRLLDPGGIGDNQQAFELTGHVWEEEPYTNDSTVIGRNPLSQHTGVTPAYGPTSHYDVLVEAGGVNRVPGDYLYRSWTANQYQVGLWGLFRVGPAACPSPTPPSAAQTCPDTVTISSLQASGATGFSVSGVTTVSPQTRSFARTVTVAAGNASARVPVDDKDGRWTYQGTGPMPSTLTVTSEYGGVASVGTSEPAPGAPAAAPRAMKERRPYTRQ